jgi:molybdate transport system regulatory protein
MSGARDYLKLGGAGRVGGDRVRLLEAIDHHGSITRAAPTLGLSYRATWEAIRTLNNLFAVPLVRAQPGGRTGGAAALTPEGHAALRALRHMSAELATAMDRLNRRLESDPAAKAHLEPWSHVMRTSVRNALRGVVTRITTGTVNSEVVLEISAGVEIVAIVTRPSIETLDLSVGAEALALIDPAFVILAQGETSPRTSARNALPGVVTTVEMGAVNSEVIVEIAEHKTLAANITGASVHSLDLKPGAKVTALIKASHVILAVE